MGYTVEHFTIYGRLERHNGPGDEADNAAWQRLQQEIRALIQSDPDYRRVTESDYEDMREVHVDG